MKLGQMELDDLLFSYLDEIRELVSPETWGSAALNCSKNELLIMLLLYRRQEVNMTQIADYIHVPLNTATGIVDRMEKKKIAERNRSREDKRVVAISLTEEGERQLQDIMNEFAGYGRKIIGALTAEELEMAGRIMDKVLAALRDTKTEQKAAPKKKVRKIEIE